MRRLLAPVVLVVAAAGVAVPAASGIPPTHESVTFADRTFTGQCSFSVFRHVLDNRSVRHTFSDGRQLLTGTFKESLTNTTTGKTIIVNASGPSLTVFNPDGSSVETSHGRQLVRPAGRLLIITGLATTVRDASGAITSFTHTTGTTQDVCVLLA